MHKTMHEEMAKTLARFVDIVYNKAERLFAWHTILDVSESRNTFRNVENPIHTMIFG